MDLLHTIINKILIARNKKPVDELPDNLHLQKDLGFSSFDLAELTVKIEDACDIDIFENGIVHTVGDIRNVLSAEKI